MTDAAAICRLLSSVRFDLSNEKATQADSRWYSPREVVTLLN